MKVTIDARDRNEGDVIRLALEDPETRVHVLVTGLLMQLPDMEARMRVLHCAKVLLFAGPLSPPLKGNGGLTLHDGDTGE